MQRITVTLLSVGLAASLVTAQAGPGMMDADPGTTGHQSLVRSTIWTTAFSGLLGSATAAPNGYFLAFIDGSISQVQTVKADLPPGEYLMSLTASNITPAYGKDVAIIHVKGMNAR